MKNRMAPKIIVALDYPTIELMREKLKNLDPSLCAVKIGKTLFTHYGPSVVLELIQLGYRVFLDLKFHDIPEQVFGAVKAAAELGVWMLTVHVLGGKKMLEAAREALREFPVTSRPILLGVTVLTSLEDADLMVMGMMEKIETLVPKLARFAKNCGLDGVVSSAQEAAGIRQAVGKDFLIVTPGIRLAGDSADDQKRVMTPERAFKAGADYLVMGRSIMQAKDPLATLKALTQ